MNYNFVKEKNIRRVLIFLAQPTERLNLPILEKI